MSKIITNSGRWKPGQSGNPKGGVRKARVLNDLLRLKGEEMVTIGGEQMTAMEVLAGAIWQFATTGEVMLAGKRLVAESVYEWASVVKWLYSHIEPTRKLEEEAEPELIVRVVREYKGEKI